MEEQNMNKKIFIVGFLLVAIFLSGFSSPCQATQQSALDNAVLVIRSLAGNITWRTSSNDVQSSFLRTGESYTYQNYFYAGSSYFILAVGCNDATDIDIILYDENGKQVDKDATTDRWGLVKVTPRWSGKFYVKVVMYATVGGGAHFITMTGFAN